MMSQITTLTFFRYTTFSQKVWAFKMMQTAHTYLQEVPGQQSYKLMGSGKNSGFNPMPDWGVYALLQTWSSEHLADQFFNDSTLMQLYLQQSTERWTIFLRNIYARGQWAGKKPFEESNQLDPNNPLVASITRATIKPRHLWAFWRFVPKTAAPLQQAQGLLFAKGIAEKPIIQIATFSVWKDEESLQNFAHQNEAHSSAIKKTHQLKWYQEELFARFQPFRSIGTWNGKNPISPLPG